MTIRNLYPSSLGHGEMMKFVLRKSTPNKGLTHGEARRPGIRSVQVFLDYPKGGIHNPSLQEPNLRW